MRSLKILAIENEEMFLLKKMIGDKLKGTRSENTKIILRRLKQRLSK